MEDKRFALTFLLLILSFSQFSLSTSKRIIDNPSMLLRQNKSFNLTSKYDVNGSHDAPRLFEKRFDFPATIGVNNSGPSVQQLGHYAGYYNLPHSKAARMFYFFFQSRGRSTDPVVIWLSGGPGSSSSVALFYENGPFKISRNLSLSWNEFGWDTVSNILYVDNPIGTGFSYSTKRSDLRDNMDDISRDLYDFLQAFFNQHPQFVRNDFYITGESYAGHYIPALALKIQKYKNKGRGIPINLKGIAIGNGLINPEIQYGSFADYAVQMRLISNSDHESLNNIYIDYRGKKSECRAGHHICNSIYSTILGKIGDRNAYDLRKRREGRLNYDFTTMETFLNQANVREALRVEGEKHFETLNEEVYEALTADWLVNYEPKIPPLLDDRIKVLIFAGEYDLVCTWLGNYRWAVGMDWSGKRGFGLAREIPFMVDGRQAGLIMNYAAFTFLRVHDAGHLVPMDQPKASLQMLRTWMHGSLAT